MAPSGRDKLSYLLQFTHPEKILSLMPAVNEATVAALFGVSKATYGEMRQSFGERALRAAEALLDDAAFVSQVDRLPFAPGSTVIGVGDSMTDDYQSWLEILRRVLAIRRPRDDIRLLNAGKSGDTIPDITSRFLSVARQKPDWILCLAGSNDVRRHGLAPTKPLVSLEETEQNLRMLRNFAATQTGARWVWMTPPAVIEPRIAEHWYFGPLQVRWSNRDVRSVAEMMRRSGDPVADIHAAFGDPVEPGLLLDDGLHPSLAGQQLILRTLVAALAG